ncbi:MAG: signal peptidase II [Lachnospiraceae bacterium]|nr:signal peptidase II [Lachnospiraceae bacterium]
MDNARGLKSLLSAAAVLALIALDQWAKHLAVVHLKGQMAVSLIRDILELLYVENMGAAFGIMNGMRLIFVLLPPVVSAVLIYVYLRMPAGRRFLPARICCIGIIAGALGNWIDRLRQGYVVDFIYFKPIDFPVFNVADIYVTCSAFLIIFLLIFYYKEEEISQIPLLGSDKSEPAAGTGKDNKNAGEGKDTDKKEM